MKRDASDGTGATYDVSKERVILEIRALQLVPPHEFVCVQIEDHDGGMGDLLRFSQDVGQAGVHDPEPIARVNFHPEGRYDLIRFRFGFLRRERVCVPVRIRDQGGGFVARI